MSRGRILYLMLEDEGGDLVRALRTINKHHNLGDAVYAVREAEGKGWDGPNVTEYSKALELVQKFLEELGDRP